MKERHVGVVVKLAATAFFKCYRDNIETVVFWPLMQALEVALTSAQ